jgi:methionine-rich copper-binding protein CopC
METIETTPRNPASARRIRAALAAVAVAAAMLWPGSSSARPMAVVESYPMVNQIMDGEATSFVLRFDGPIDHASARLTLTTPTGAARQSNTRVSDNQPYISRWNMPCFRKCLSSPKPPKAVAA